jgi:hypothetical protein
VFHPQSRKNNTIFFLRADYTHQIQPLFLKEVHEPQIKFGEAPPKNGPSQALLYEVLTVQSIAFSRTMTVPGTRASHLRDDADTRTEYAAATQVVN